MLATGKVALGDMQQQTRINGVLASNDFNGLGPVQTFPGGYFALPTNSGTYTRDRFAVVPEANLSVGYQVNRVISVFAGYSFLYLSNVARPGEQIDRVINPSQGTAFTGTVPAPLVGPAGRRSWATLPILGARHQPGRGVRVLTRFPRCERGTAGVDWAMNSPPTRISGAVP